MGTDFYSSVILCYFVIASYSPFLYFFRFFLNFLGFLTNSPMILKKIHL